MTATIVSISRTAIVINTPPRSTVGSKSVSIVYPTLTLTGGVVYDSLPTFDTPPMMSGTSFPLSGGVLTVYGAKFGTSASLWKLTNGGTVLTATSIGSATPSQTQSWVTFDIPASSSWVNAGDWVLTCTSTSSVNLKIRINYFKWLNASIEYVDMYRHSTAVSGPWASGSNPVVEYVLIRSGYTVFMAANFGSFTGGAYTSSAEVVTVSGFPEQFRPPLTIRCSNHIGVSGSGYDGHADYRGDGVVKYYHTGSGSAYTSVPSVPTVYAGTCYWTLPN